MTSYRVPARDAEAEIEVKRSRFLATLRRVADEGEARALVEQCRREHWSARHHCTAWIVGVPPQPVQRSSDDGEPAGTAGAPMLEVLRGAGLSDVAVVVTRWFGGTLLGAGGLVRAYGDAVRAVVEAAGARERALIGEYSLSLEHADAGRVESDLRNRGVVVLDVAYGVRVRLLLGVEPSAEEALRATVAELSGGSAELVVEGESWADRP